MVSGSWVSDILGHGLAISVLGQKQGCRNSIARGEREYHCEAQLSLPVRHRDYKEEAATCQAQQCRCCGSSLHPAIRWLARAWTPVTHDV